MVRKGFFFGILGFDFHWKGCHNDSFDFLLLILKVCNVFWCDWQLVEYLWEKWQTNDIVGEICLLIAKIMQDEFMFIIFLFCN